MKQVPNPHRVLNRRFDMDILDQLDNIKNFMKRREQEIEKLREENKKLRNNQKKCEIHKWKVYGDPTICNKYNDLTTGKPMRQQPQRCTNEGCNETRVVHFD